MSEWHEGDMIADREMRDRLAEALRERDQLRADLERRDLAYRAMALSARMAENEVERLRELYDLHRVVVNDIVRFHQIYDEKTMGCGMPGNDYYSGLLMDIVKRATFAQKQGIAAKRGEVES